MALTDVYANTLSELSTIRQTMLSPEWQDSLDGASKEDRLDASHKLLKVQQAILKLSDSSLSAIADKLQAQTGALQAATKDVNDTLADITRVQDVLDAVGTMIGVVAKVVSLL